MSYVLSTALARAWKSLLERMRRAILTCDRKTLVVLCSVMFSVTIFVSYSLRHLKSNIGDGYPGIFPSKVTENIRNIILYYDEDQKYTELLLPIQERIL